MFISFYIQSSSQSLLRKHITKMLTENYNENMDYRREIVSGTYRCEKHIIRV